MFGVSMVEFNCKLTRFSFVIFVDRFDLEAIKAVNCDGGGCVGFLDTML